MVLKWFQIRSKNNYEKSSKAFQKNCKTNLKLIRIKVIAPITLKVMDVKS